MRKITKTIYKFNELSEKAKKFAKDKYYEVVGTDDNNEQFQETANELLHLIGFEVSAVNYSLSSCQGDGLTYSFKLYSSDIIDMLETLKGNKPKEDGFVILQELHDKLFKVVESLEVDKQFIDDNDIVIYTQKIDNRYSHKYTKSIEIESDEENVSEYTKSLQKAYQNIYYVVCDFLEKYGYECIYEVMSDEEFTEMSESNDYEYYENGTQY